MWVEFVGSLLCSEDFLRVYRFSSLLKNQHLIKLIWFELVSPISSVCTQLVIIMIMIIIIIVSITKFSIMIASPGAYLSRNRRVITWVSN